ncbi:MAG: hypothetical protein COA42_03230 [Alteromonadaceae bacterium]|nr:MAG: hypothetical protein COA42_03230 [Alteromonadaceae bacterium]
MIWFRSQQKWRHSFRLTVLLFISSLPCASLFAFIPQEIHFRHINDNQEIALGDIRGIAQDKHGFIWFGSAGGLARFDGYELQLMARSSTPNQTATNINDMLFDGDTLWLATNNGLIEYDSNDNTLIRHTDNGNTDITLSHNFITSVNLATTGELITTSFNGLTVINPERNKVAYYTSSPEAENRQNANQHEKKTLHDRRNHLRHPSTWTSYFDRNQRLLIGTATGIDIMDWKTGQINPLTFANGSLVKLGDNEIRSIFQQSNGDYWVSALTRGLFRINLENNTLKHYFYQQDDPNSLGANSVWDITEDSLGVLWIATDKGGLNIYNPEADNFVRFKHHPDKPTSISSNVIRSVMEDRQGGIWVANFPNGANYYNRNTSTINLYTNHTDDQQSLNDNSVLSFSEDKNDNLWIGTDTGGLNYFNRKTNTFTHYTHDANNPTSISSNAITSLLIDSQEQLWVGSWAAGLNLYQPETQTFNRKPLGEQIYQELKTRSIWALYEDSNNELWIGTEDHGVYRYNPHNQVFTQYKNNLHDATTLSGNFVRRFLEDFKGRFWVASNNGLNLLNRETGKFKTVDDTDINKIIHDKHITTLFEDSQQRLWIGSIAGLSWYKHDTTKFKTLRKNDGFANDNIRSVIEDPIGTLWVGTGNGLASINFSDYKITNYKDNTGWLNGAANNNAVLRTSRGELAFGSINGMQIFKVDQLIKNTHAPNIVLTEFGVHTKPVYPYQKNGLLKALINNTDKITLDHQYNMFSFSFSALNFQDPFKNHYAYKLEGFDKDWRYVSSKQRTAVYTNLDAGKYTFRVKGSNNNDVWNEEGKSITLEQLPHPWKTWWAYTLYLSAFALLLLWIYRQKTHKLQYEKDLQEKINKKLINLDRLKSDFLANTSHELLTPLNGIIGISEILSADLRGSNEKSYMHANMITASGRRLAALVGNILDFSKISDNSMQLKLQPVNLGTITDEAIEILASQVIGKPITINNYIKDKDIHVIADKERFQHILNNLLTNAIKYTKQGKIDINYKIDDDNKIYISITDTGIGIAPENQELIFQAFDQQEDVHTKEQQGASLGLALTKKLIELHGGHLHVESQLNKGSRFTFDLPIASKEQIVTAVLSHVDLHQTHSDDNSDQPPKTTQHTPEQIDLPPTTSAKTIPEKATPANKSPTQPGARILVVDDDAVNRIVLRGLLNTQHYSIDEADCGPAALEKIHGADPFDLIILDVMMPKMSGFEVCQKLRLKYAMHELPILFLTAKTTPDALSDGFAAGGNDFLTKPTSKAELLPRVAALLHMKVGTCDTA